MITYFWSPTCSPCKRLGPQMEQLCAEKGIELRKVNLAEDEGALLAQQAGVQSVPVLLIGNARVEGAQARIRNITEVIEEELGL